MKHEGWGPTPLSADQSRRLEVFEDLLRTRAVPLGMIARSDLEDIRRRHIADSLRGVPLIPSGAERACDLGSGAGLPGIPVAVACPDLSVTLSESRTVRAAFLELAVEVLELQNAVVFPAPVEELPGGEFAVCFARGYAGPRKAWSSADRLLRPGGALLYWAGETFDGRGISDGVTTRLPGDPTLESGGPIAIMTRQ